MKSLSQNNAIQLEQFVLISGALQQFEKEFNRLFKCGYEPLAHSFTLSEKKIPSIIMVFTNHQQKALWKFELCKPQEVANKIQSCINQSFLIHTLHAHFGDNSVICFFKPEINLNIKPIKS